MNALTPSSHRTIAASLAKHAEQVEAAGPGRWSFQLDGGARLQGAACHDSGWLSMEARQIRRAERKQPPSERFSRMIRANAELDDGVKFVLGDGPGEVRLAAEMPLEADDDLDPGPWIGRVCAGFREGVRRLASRAAPGPSHEADDVADPAEPDHEADGELAALCQQAQWPFTQRASGQVVVPLDVPDELRGLLQASLAPGPAGVRRLRVELAGAAPQTPVCRVAVEVLLLTACRTVRLARAIGVRVRGGEGYGWEAVWEPEGGPRNLDHALAALSVACRMTALEVGVLHEETFARRYLAMRGIVG